MRKTLSPLLTEEFDCFVTNDGSSDVCFGGRLFKFLAFKTAIHFPSETLFSIRVLKSHCQQIVFLFHDHVLPISRAIFSDLRKEDARFPLGFPRFILVLDGLIANSKKWVHVRAH